MRQNIATRAVANVAVLEFVDTQLFFRVLESPTCWQWKLSQTCFFLNVWKKNFRM